MGPDTVTVGLDKYLNLIKKAEELKHTKKSMDQLVRSAVDKICEDVVHCMRSCKGTPTVQDFVGAIRALSPK